MLTTITSNDTPNLCQPNPIHVAIVGFGKQGETHYNACLDNSDLAQVVAIIDEKPLSLTLPLDIHPYRSLKQAIQNVDLDAVIIATPPNTYQSIVEEASNYQLPILLEKPLGMNLSEAGKLIDICEKRNCLLMLAAQRRFHPTFVKVSERLREKVHKENRALTAEMELSIQVPKEVSSDNWRVQVGAMLDLGFHAIDLGRLWFGELQLVSASVFNAEGRICRDRIDSEAHLLLKTETGTLFRIRIGRSKEKRERVSISLGDTILVATRKETKQIEDGREVVLQDCDGEWDVAMRGQLHELNQACRQIGGRQMGSLSAMNGLITMKLIEEAYDRSEIS